MRLRHSFVTRIRCTGMSDDVMPDVFESLEEIDQRISVLRENLRDLIAQASGYAGAADEELISRRIAEQEAQLDGLTKRRVLLANTSA